MMQGSDSFYIVLIAGLPNKIEGSLKSRLEGLRNAKFDIVPLYSNNSLYSYSYLKHAYKILHGSVKRFVLNRDGTMRAHNLKGAYAIFVNAESNARGQILRHFGLELPIFFVDCPTEVYNQRQSGNRLKTNINTIMSQLEARLGQGEALLKMLTRELTSNSNKTPLLLPRNNFGERDIDRMTSRIQEVTCANKPSEALTAVLEEIKNQFHRVTTDHSPRKSFVNSRNLIFCSPEKNRHGFAAVSASECNYKCLVRGWIRFGVFYDPQFHYDCRPQNEQRIGRSWTGCHGQDILISKKRTHVNVAPNDFVR